MSEYNFTDLSSLFGEQKTSSINDIKRNKIYSYDGIQYIKENMKENARIKYSGNFYLRCNVWMKISSYGILSIFNKHNFIALVELDNEEEIDFSNHFDVLKEKLYRKLKIMKVLEDALSNKVNEDYRRLKEYLCVVNEETQYLNRVDNLYQFPIILKQISEFEKIDNPNIEILEKIIANKYISSELINIATHLLESEKHLMERNNIFPVFFLPKRKPINLITYLQNVYENGIKNHKKLLLDKCECCNPKLKSNLQSIPDELILCIQKQDIELFVDLYNESNNAVLNNFVDYLQDNLFKKINKIKHPNSIKNIAPLTDPIYYFLWKNLKEVITDIGKNENKTFSDLISVEQGKLILLNDKKLSNTLHDCFLRQQCDVINKIMTNFQPGNYCFKQKLNYKFKLLQDLNDKTWWGYIKDWTGFANTVNKNKFSVSVERLAWLYIFDNVISHHIDETSLPLFKTLIEHYRNFILDTETDSHQLFRVVTKNIMSIVIQIKSDFFNQKTNLKFKDLSIAKFLNQYFTDTKFMSNDFRDLININNKFLRIKNLIIKFPDKFFCYGFISDMEEIRDKLLNLIDFETTETVELQILYNYFRSFSDFFADLHALQFNWFIKNNFDLDFLNHLIKEKIIELVDNKFSAEEHKTYLVLDEGKFVKILNFCEEIIPKHYLIDIMKILLSILNESLINVPWNNFVERLNATNDLLSAIRSSFLYYKEQPDYVRFDVFKKESTEPFISALRTSKSYQEFVKRINIIKDSFWYLRKQDEIDVKEALNLYQQINDAVNIEILEKHYKRYFKKFSNYIYETFDKNHEDKIKFIVDVVQSQRKSLNFHEWDSEFKSEFVPTLLAGLAAVWAIKRSKDIETTGKLLIPHCVQILCILRLLSVDREMKGVEKHLIEVLTGQGKSLVLGLLSSLLAMTDHRVQIVCYSDYLANRDKDDFCEFFKEFGIAEKIQYCTFDKIASECININGQMDLRDLVENKIFNRNTKSTQQKTQNCVDNTILLIDEVDVFFSDKYYGSTYNPGGVIEMLALVNIQEKIWEIVQNNLERKSIKNLIENYINDETYNGNESFFEFHQFRSDPYWYNLLDDNGIKIIKREYSNKTLWEDILDSMIEHAIIVVQREKSDYFLNKYKIIDDIIHLKDKNSIYRKYLFSYESIFYYFKLKQRNFDHKNYENYGYLIINCGSISYAKLPENYPLILGVSGTLSTLNDYEKEAIKKHYNINYISNMPSFFGYSHLTFDPNKNFICCDSEEKWLDQIYHYANSMIDLGRSVLIFFDSDKDITKFQRNFYNKFNRLNILTGNSECKDVLIDQAGITKTLTLVTREMGRGVDFKSSVTVEKYGGIHVIQTFFSLDVKEETQIKGRTARKDNKGSYEIIVCKDHLIKASLLNENESTVNYQSLNESRTIKMEEYGEKISIEVKKLEQNHQETMNYYQHLLQL